MHSRNTKERIYLSVFHSSHHAKNWYVLHFITLIEVSQGKERNITDMEQNNIRYITTCTKVFLFSRDGLESANSHLQTFTHKIQVLPLAIEIYNYVQQKSPIHQVKKGNFNNKPSEAKCILWPWTLHLVGSILWTYLFIFRDFFFTNYLHKLVFGRR